MGCEFCESALANCVGTLAVDYVVKPVGRQLDYVRRFHDNVEKLVEKKGELAMAQTRLQQETEDAEKLLLHIGDDVRDLQTKAVKILSNVETLEMEIPQNKTCLNWCPNWSWRYRLSKKAMKKTLDIYELLEKINKFGQPGRVGYRAPSTLPTIEFLCSKEFVVSESSKIAFHQIIEALQDDNISMIGLWGMGGVGKTTLAREVGNQAEKLNLFNKISARFMVETEEGTEVIILDDIWTNINLKEKIGIPTGEDHKGCKVLLTTRRQQVCLAMDCQKVVQLGCLHGDEAWNLFATKASLNGSADDAIRKVATKIIRKCQGLPIAIVSLGSALKGKSCHEWKAAYRRLKDRRLTEIEDVNEENAYLCLEASFDYLKGMETKTCFLLCSLYPEDHEIYVEDLVRYAWGLELYKGINSIEKVRSEVLASIEILKNSCLLLDCGESHVKMHDVVREVALWIASSREKFSFASVGTLPMDESFKHFIAISFNTDQMGELPKGLVFPNLKFLLLGGTSESRKENSSELFEGMKALKACALDNQLISPVAFQFQMNLKTLKLHFCRFSDISMLGKLKTLEILSLSGSRISELPNEIGDLENLRLLELSNCRKLRRISHRLIQRLSNLEELYLHGCSSIKWATENTIEKECYCSLSELNLLPKLGVLLLDLHPQHLPYGFVLELEFSKLTSLGLDSCDGMKCLIDASKQQVPTTAFSNLRSLSLASMLALEKLCNGPQPQGFLQKLETLSFWNCNEMIGAIPISQNLEELQVHQCGKMQVLFQTVELRSIEQWPNHHLSLQSLKVVQISDCNSLKYLFPMSAANNSLGQLQSLDVRRCSELEEIIQGTEVLNISPQSLRKIRISECNKLTSLSSLSHGHRLQELSVDDCPRLTPLIISAKIQKLELRRMTSEQLSNLDICNCEEEEQITEKDQTSSHDHQLQPICFPNLTLITIFNCENLKCLFPITVAHGGLPKLISASNLQTLEIRNCSQLEEIIQDPQVSSISLQCLREIKVENCYNLRYLFPMSIANSLGGLRTLQISRCFGLEEIIKAKEASNVCLHSLMEVFVRECNKLTSLSSLSHGHILKSLTNLEIYDYLQLEDTFPISMAQGLPLLDEVVLENLPQFKGRDGNEIVLTLSSLQKLKVVNCPKLTPFIISTKIQKLTLQRMKERKIMSNMMGRGSSVSMEYLKISSFKELFDSSYNLSSLKFLELFELTELRVIWNGPIQAVNFQNLTELKVGKCGSLRYIFSATIARNLPRLSRLEIFACEELEQIIEKDQTSSQHHLQPICFPSLANVIISDCENLKYLFPITSAHGGLPKLKTISLGNVSKFKQVFEGDEANVNKDEEKVNDLPQLTYLELGRLPNLMSFSFSPASQSVDESIVEGPATAQETTWPAGSNIMEHLHSTKSSLILKFSSELDRFEEKRINFHTWNCLSPCVCLNLENRILQSSFATMGCEFCESALANSVGTLVVDHVVKPVGRQLHYVRRFHDNVEKLLEKKGELVRARTRLQHETEDAERQLLHIEDDVRDLQTKAVEILSNVGLRCTMVAVADRPEWGVRYRLSKKAIKKTLDLSELLEKINKFGQPGRVGYRAPSTLPTIEFLCSEEFVVSKASKIAFHQIIRALQDDNISMIGLWGMGGVGKTTLAREVGNQAKKLNLFNEVVITTVSQKPNFQVIQDQIAEFIGFDVKNERGRRSVQDLWLRLKKEQRILIILDDIWTNINLKEKIGIPTGEDHKGCKVLLTTRRQQVCLALDCQKVVQLGCLDGDEAWNLFATKASLNGSADDAIRKVATKIIRKCQGLPIAIVSLGSALKGKSCHEWKAAYRRPKDRRLTEIEDVSEENAYLCLKASFDYLKGMETKTCFLLCSLYPEDHEIYVEDLVRYAWGLELYKGINSIEKVRSEVLASIEILKNSCLLLDCRRKGLVKMHDVVREVALWIASSRGEFSFATVGTLPMDESFKHFMAISFNTDQMGELPKGLVFPNLKFLLLGRTGGGRMETSSEFFEGMKALKACALDNILISPVAFQFQMNLKTLKLHYCRFSNISMLGKLKTLEIFSLSRSRISELPNAIGDLENLRLLELSYCKELRRIPHRLIQRLSNLEELYLHGCWSIKWATENTTEKECYSSLSEFDVFIGLTLREPSKHCSISRSLEIFNESIDACKQLFEDVESLGLKAVQGCPNLIPSLELDFSKLTSLRLQRCDGMKCLIDASKQQVPTTSFSNLRSLSLASMLALEELCNGPQPQGFLQKLETLSLRNCNEMIGAIPISQNLEELHVHQCGKMQVLFQTVELRSINQWPNHHLSLRSLKVVQITDCNSLKYLFPMSAANNSLGQLQSLDIQRCSQLEEIIQGTEVLNISPQSLRKIRVSECNKLTSLFSLSHGHRLQELSVDDCPRLTPLIISAKIQKLELRRMTSEQLSNLDICNCEEEEQITEKDQTSSHDHQLQPICFPNLTLITIFNCENLKCLFPITVAHGGLPKLISASNLQTLEIRNCSQLEEIIQDPQVSSISLQCLREIKVENCYNLSLGGLRTLQISRCFGLEEIIKAKEASNVCLHSLMEVFVRECNKLTSLSSLSHGHILKSLTNLEIYDCLQLEDTFPISMAQGLPLLDEVVLENLPQFKGRDGNEIVLTLSLLQKLKVELTLQRMKERKIMSNMMERGGSSCGSLRYIFSPTIAQNLPRLRELYISGCKELEQIIDEDQASKQHHLQPICFPSLAEVVITGCENLKYLFPITSAHGGLPKLKTISLRNVSKLEQVFEGDEANVSNDEEKVIHLPQLTSLDLGLLPNLMSFSPVGYHFVFPSLKQLAVEGCPNLTTRFSVDSEQSGHAKTQASQSVDESIVEESATAQETTWPAGSNIRWRKRIH
ncbi:disease resistance protein [Gossypium australe]|uniref:Disease resistance protein n=1 Tax=Gossypium australe TaxID=47621 RepID=A0A5B6U5L3_9ROSI|nr:disease resistance protein [Gossypium australe]